MKRTFLTFLVSGLLAAAMLVPAAALAQAKDAKKPAASPGAGQAGGTTAQPRVKNYDFDADDVDGELVKPEGEFLNARKFAEHGSLIRVRADFIREIVKSAEDL